MTIVLSPEAQAKTKRIPDIAQRLERREYSSHLPWTGSRSRLMLWHEKWNRRASMDTEDGKNATSFKTGSQVQKGGANSSKRCRALLKDMERQMILDSMVRNQQYKAAVARELGIPLSTLKRRLKE